MLKKVLSILLSIVLLIGTFSVFPVQIMAAEADLTDTSVEVDLGEVGIPIKLHVWMSDSPMGEVPSNFYARNDYYMCYELVDSNGTKLNSLGEYNYTVTETMYGVNGNQECSYKYSNSDYNWIRLTAYEAGVYKGTVSVTGDLTIAVNVDYKLQYKAAASANPTKVSLTLGDSNKATLRISPSGNYPGIIAGSWEHDSNIANVSFRGWDGDTAILDIKGLKAGRTNLVYSIDEAYTDDRNSVAKITVPITVTAKEEPIIQPSSISLNYNSLTLGVDESYVLNAVISPGNATNKRISWSSNAVGVATVSNGKITARGVGNATITARTANGKTAKCNVTVKKAPSSISLNKTSLTLGVGEQFDFDSSLPAGCAAHSIVYSSSNPSVCTVKSSGGLATAKSSGTATITATAYNGRKASCTVTVKKAPTSVSLNKSSLTLRVGEQFDFDSSLPGGCAAYSIKYSSSNPSVCSVKESGGVATANRVGAATITAKTYNGKKASCSVKVISASDYTYASPSISSLSSIARGVKISWKSVGAAKYRVYYYGSKGWTKMGETTGTSFIDEDVRVGTTYRYTVRCINSDGTTFTSDCNSTGWKYTYQPKLDTPKITECETVSNGVKIYWKAVTNAYKYRVYYKNRNGNWVKMGDTTGTSFVDTVVKGGSTYTYTVRCLAAKEGDFASSHESGKSHTYVETPSITKLENVSNGVKISWTAKTGATRYRVYYKNRSGNWVKMKETASTSYLDTDVSNGGNYTYTVRCVNANGDFTSWFNTSGWKCTYSFKYVTDAFNKSYRANDGYSVTCRLPKILLDSSDISAINSEIIQKYQSFITMNEKQHGSSRTGYAYMFKMSYSYYVNGDILSLVIKNTFCPSNGYSEYSVYNVNLKSYTRITRNSLINSLGLNWDKTKTVIKGKIKKSFNDYYGSNYLNDWYIESISTSNLNMSELYLGDNNQPYVIYRWKSGTMYSANGYRYEISSLDKNACK